jgi:hypothetical protein
LEWLEQNPIEDLIDIAFLKDAVDERKAIADATRKEDIDNNARLSAGYWNSTACLRLIHALVDHDKIKSKFLNRLNLPAGHSTIENREHNWATDVWHLLANKWNDKDFAPEIMSLPQLHTKFALPDIILHSEVAALTPAILEMNHCIANWQKSGQGEGGIDDLDNAEDQVFGSLANRSLHALASRQSFFSDRQAYLLYLWEMLDWHDLLGSALQKLSSSVSSTNGASGVPSVVRVSENDADSMSDKSASAAGNSIMSSLGKSIENHGQSLIAVAKLDAEKKERMAKLDLEDKERDRAHQLKMDARSVIRQLSGEKCLLLLQHAAETQKKNKFMADAITEQIEDIDKQLEKHSSELESMESTPKKNNRTPESASND